MKNNSNEDEYKSESPQVNLFYRTMRITTFLLFFCSFCAFAGTVKSQSAKVTLQKSNVTLLDVLNEIEHQTNYLFIYSNNINVKRPVSIQVNQTAVDKVLTTLFAGENVSYILEGTHIVLTKNKAGENVLQAVQQSKNVQITGTVVDENGEPLIGVSIVVKGTANGTVTNMDGDFTLNVKHDDVLDISYIGYTTVTQKAGTSPLKIVMKEDSQKLDEVIVVGYGTTTKRSMIAAVSSVKAEQMENLPITNITQGLAGRAPGLIVQASGGGVNAKSKVSIRGGDTPLVVIDGVIRDYSDFTAIAPENIASMSILKDASATAVYGSRASNGILQITTKKGTVGKPRIEYSFNQSWSQPTVWPKKLDSYNIGLYKNLAAKNDGLALPYSDEDLRKYQDGSDPEFHPNTDWEALTLNNFAPQQKHNLNITGGTEAHNFYMSVGLIDQNSLYKNNNHYMKRTNFQLSDNVTIKEIGLKATAQLDGYLQKTVHPLTSTASDYASVFGHIVQRSPMDIGVNKYGLPYNVGDNPVAETASDTGYKNEKENVINGLLNLEWSIPWVKGLKARATGNYRFYQKDNKNWRKNPAQYNWDSTEPIYRNQPQLSQYMETGTSWTLQYFAEYGRTFGKHTIDALGGYECSYAKAHSTGLSRDSYEFAIDQINPGPTATMKNWGGESESGRAAWIGQLKYNYDNRYFVEGSIRYDGSDNFPESHRWGTFYSGSLGWSLADEAFMETIREKNIFNMLKIRASYGEVGLDNWGDDDDPFHIGRFAYLPSYGLDGMAYVVNGKYVAGFSEGALPSPDLSWFTTKQFDFGVDFSSLNDRLYGMVDYFYYQTKGFLYAPDQLNVGYTDPLGPSLPKVSTDGEHRRAGFEFQLGWRDNIGRDFQYDVSFNMTKFDQLWASDPRESLDSKKNPYKRTTQQVGYSGIYNNCLGYYTSAEDVYNSVKRLNSTNLTAGDLKYEDFNGDGVIDDADQYRMGKSSFPRANYGFNLNLSYKGISFGALFQGATRYDMYLGSGLMMASEQSGTTPFYDFQKDFWTPENTDARFPRIISNNGINGQNNSINSNFWLINGGYFRLKDITISYDFKKLLLKKQPWISKLNVGLSGQNIFTISEATKYGLDPENANTNRYDYPVQRVFAININVGF